MGEETERTIDIAPSTPYPIQKSAIISARLVVSINIKNREAEALLAELKAATGKGTSQLVLDLLRREAQRLRARRVRSADDAEARMAQLHRELAAQPVLDPRSADEILGYDDNGLPN